MDESARPCPLCGQTLEPGVRVKALGQHFPSCPKTDYRRAGRREIPPTEPDARES